VSGPWLFSYVALWLVVLFQGFLILGLFRELGVRLANRGAELDKRGLAIGVQAPALVTSQSVEAKSGIDGRATVIVFGSRQCAPCRELAKPLDEFAIRHKDHVDVYFVTDESPREAAVTRDDLELRIPVIGDHGASQRFDVPVTPFAFVVDAKGVIRSKGIVNQIGGLEWLWSEASSAEPDGVQHRRPVWR
jgi:AhpC/TSA family